MLVTPPHVLLLLHRAGSGAARLPARPLAAPPGARGGLLLFFLWPGDVAGNDLRPIKRGQGGLKVLQVRQTLGVWLSEAAR